MIDSIFITVFHQIKRLTKMVKVKQFIIFKKKKCMYSLRNTYFIIKKLNFKIKNSNVIKIYDYKQLNQFKIYSNLIFILNIYLILNNLNNRSLQLYYKYLNIYLLLNICSSFRCNHKKVLELYLYFVNKF